MSGFRPSRQQNREQDGGDFASRTWTNRPLDAFRTISAVRHPRRTQFLVSGLPDRNLPRHAEADCRGPQVESDEGPESIRALLVGDTGM
jgi:hypothetical protein